MDIISMAQHARPNASGQSEFLRAQFTALSSWLRIMPSFCRTLLRSSGLSRVTTFRLPSTLIRLPRSYFLTPRRDRKIREEFRALSGRLCRIARAAPGGDVPARLPPEEKCDR